MKLFKDDYRKQFEALSPSPALEQETLALMAEAQDHGFPTEAPKSKKPLILSLSLSGAAAMLAVTIGLAVWFNRPDAVQPDEMGNIQSVIGGNSQSAQSGNSQKPESGSASKGDSSSSNKGEELPVTDSYESEGDDQGTPPEDTPEGDSSAGGSAAPEGTDDENTSSAPAASPLGPVVIEDKNTQTYLSIQAYLDALAAKKTIGYNANYLADPSLIIVPSWLPQSAQFRHFYAKSNGAYSYSYLITDGGNQYFLEISSNATFPRTLRDLNLRVRSIKGEYEGMDKAENKRIYYFGTFDRVTVTLTTANGAAPTLEETDRILADLQLDRYTVQNTLVQLEYGNP